MKSLKIYLIAGGVFLLLYIIAEANRPKPINWTENLNSREKAPFGTYILFSRLHDIFPGVKIVPYRRSIYNAIAEDSISYSSYVIIAQSVNFSEYDYDQIARYVKAGNNLFVAAENFGGAFEKELKIETRQYYELIKGEHPVKFLNPMLDSSRYYALDKGIGSIYFSSFDTVKAVALGQNARHKVNFLKVQMGKGSLYLLSNPLFFSNYSLLDKVGQQYAATALSYVKNTSKLVWDEYYTQGDDENDSPMRLFLSDDSLRWAYYIAIFTLIGFVVFEVKRRQRVIPVALPLSNSSVDFVNVVGQVYYEKKDDTDIVQKKITYFLAFLRETYQVKTNPLDEDFIDTLSQKTGVDEKFINELVGTIRNLNGKQKISRSELVELNRLIEQFYIKSR